mmetsp:Transcript_25732/g.40893  ORF Transcript_25732/g.40893 Transcript_25732/m.40893 type:complete len:80 (-) Transcript_25732:494-733(-)
MAHPQLLWVYNRYHTPSSIMSHCFMAFHLPVGMIPENLPLLDKVCVFCMPQNSADGAAHLCVQLPAAFLMHWYTGHLES